MDHCFLPDCFFRLWTKVKQHLFSIYFNSFALFVHALMSGEYFYCIFSVSGCEAFFLMSSRSAFLDNMQSTLHLQSFWLKKKSIKKKGFEVPNQVFKVWYIVIKITTKTEKDKAEIQQVPKFRLWPKMFNSYKFSLVFTYVGQRYPLLCSSWLISYIFMYIPWAALKEASVRLANVHSVYLSSVELNQLFW